MRADRFQGQTLKTSFLIQRPIAFGLNGMTEDEPRLIRLKNENPFRDIFNIVFTLHIEAF
jgi:hypothetical protein